MRLLELEIRHLAGIEAPFSVQFEPATLNLITGPNASGKSSLVRAVRAVLFPEPLAEYCEINTRWEDDEGILTGQRIATEVRWSRAGHNAAPPNLAGIESASAFLVSTEDLTAPGRTEGHMAGELKTLLAGGYDLDAVRGHGPLIAPARPQKLARRAEDLHQAIRAKEQEYTHLHDEFQQLQQFNEQLEEATRAAARVGRIDDALALAEAIARRSALENTLIEEFPGGMDRLRGDEMQRLEQARQQLKRKQHSIVQEHSALKAEREQLARSGIDDPDRLEGLQAELGELRDRLAALEQQTENETEQLAQAQQSCAEAATRLGGNLPDEAEQLDQQALEQIEKQVDKILALRERTRALSGQLALAQASRNLSGRPQEDLRAARSALQDWLALARLSPLEGPIWGTLSAAALIGGLRLLAGASLSEQPELLLLVGLAVGLPAAMLVRFVLRIQERNRARSGYAQTQIEPPLGWSEPEVRARLKRLEIELEAATQHEVSQLRAGELHQQLNQQRGALDRARAQLTDQAAALGLSAEQRLETSFLLWSRNLQDWQQRARRVRDHQARLDRLQARHRAVEQEATGLLQSHGLDGEEVNARTLASLIHQLAPKIRRHAELYNSIQARERRVGELHADISQANQQLTDLFDAAGVRQDDDDTLRGKSDLFARWRELESERIDLDREVARLEQRLAGEQALRDLAARQALQELAALREQTDRQASERDPLNRRIAEIQTRHADTLQRRELERLGGELEATRDLLQAERARHLLAAGGQFLIDEVAAIHRAEQEPAMLTAADRWLGRFTGHRYRLEFDGERFEAVDTRSDRRQAVSSLSTGTRAQLMLALRLAWIEQLERRFERLPLFMDEVLTTSDPDRYRAVVQAVAQLVASDRQVVYLTAQSDDAQAWREWLGPDLQPHEINMGEIRDGQVRQLAFHMPEAPESAPELIDPDGMAADEWAQAVGVPPINRWQGVNGMNVFHLLRDDLGLAHRLMENELGRVGPLERFLALRAEHPDAPCGWLNDADAERLSRRIDAGRRILTDWQQRHKRPVDRATLERCGILSKRFLPRVAKLARHVEHDPVALLEALDAGQVARFRSDTLEELSQWLAAQDYLPGEHTEPLTAAELGLACGLETTETRQLQGWIENAIADPLIDNPETCDEAKDANQRLRP